MKIAVFCQSLVTDYNYPVAHFLRGLISEIQKKHEVVVYEREQNEPLSSTVKDYGKTPVNEFYRCYPQLNSVTYDHDSVASCIEGFDLVFVHSATDMITLNILTELKLKESFRFVFYDDGFLFVDNMVLIREMIAPVCDMVVVNCHYIREFYMKIMDGADVEYLPYGVDLNIFHPRSAEKEQTAVLSLDWSDACSVEELEEFFIKPVRDLRIKASVYGGRYPRHIKKILADHSIDYKGWLPSFKVPEVFARYTTAIHLPAKDSLEVRAGTVSMRMLESIASGIPVISAPWKNGEKVLTPARDYLQAGDSYEMTHYMLEMMNSTLCEVISGHGLKLLSSKHTCRLRAQELSLMLNRLVNQNHLLSEPL